MRILSVCTPEPHREGDSMGGLPSFTERKFLPELGIELGTPSAKPVCYPLDYRFILLAE